MKSTIRKNVIRAFLFASILFGCNDNSVTYRNKKDMRLEIVPSDSITINWGDSTTYQHNADWHSYLDTVAYDSLANFFKNSEILIEDMWCPNEDMSCKIPYTPGMEIILRLTKPDTSIFRYGFHSIYGFPLSCYKYWRHYKYTFE